MAVLVRPPLRVLDAGPVRRPFHHAAARVRLATSAGPLTVVSTHLNPYFGGWRRWEAQWLATTLRRGRSELALLAGDLNTLDPAVRHEERLAGLPMPYRRRHLRRDGRTVDTRAVSRLLTAGLVDLWTARPGAGRGRTGSDCTTGTGHRVAGMRAGLPARHAGLAARLCDAGCARRRRDHASDHTVVVDLELDPA